MPYKHSAGLLAAPAAQWDSCRKRLPIPATQSTIQFEVNQQESASPLGKLCAKINTQLVLAEMLADSSYTINHPVRSQSARMCSTLGQTVC